MGTHFKNLERLENVRKNRQKSVNKLRKIEERPTQVAILWKNNKRLGREGCIKRQEELGKDKKPQARMNNSKRMAWKITSDLPLYYCIIICVMLLLSIPIRCH